MLHILAGQVEFYPDSQEEQLPGFGPQFPLISSHVTLQNGSPWHWHRSFQVCLHTQSVPGKMAGH